MEHQEIYRELINWLNRDWYRLPEAEELLPLISTFYTVDEARLLTGFPHNPTSREELADYLKMDVENVDPALATLARKGAVWRLERNGQVRYRINDAFFVFFRSAFWGGRKDQVITDVSSLMNEYYRHGFMDQFAPAETKGLRAIPVQKTVPNTKTIRPYEDVAQYLDAQDYYSVSSCPCRSRKNLDPHSPDCKHPVEVCLHFGVLGRYTVANGLGREITKDQAHQILKMAADSGLVHGLTNWQTGADTICNCCRCCCLFMEAYHVLGHHRSLDPSNYVIETNPGICKACGLCESRCPMDALTLVAHPEATNKKGLAPRVEADRCLGCGVCVHKCPSGSLTLKSRPVTTDPPVDAREWMKRFMHDQLSGPKLRTGGNSVSNLARG